MSRLADLEDLVPDFHDYPEGHDDTFEQEFLRPRLEAMGFTAIRFCCGRQSPITGNWSDRTVQTRTPDGERKEFKYGRR